MGLLLLTLDSSPTTYLISLFESRRAPQIQHTQNWTPVLSYKQFLSLHPPSQKKESILPDSQVQDFGVTFGPFPLISYRIQLQILLFTSNSIGNPIGSTFRISIFSLLGQCNSLLSVLSESICFPRIYFQPSYQVIQLKCTSDQVSPLSQNLWWLPSLLRVKARLHAVAYRLTWWSVLLFLPDSLTPSSIIFLAHAPGHTGPWLCLEFVTCASLKTSALAILAAQRAFPPDACTRSCITSCRCLLNVTFSEKPGLATLFKITNSCHGISIHFPALLLFSL